MLVLEHVRVILEVMHDAAAAFPGARERNKYETKM